MKMQRRFGKYI